MVLSYNSEQIKVTDIVHGKLFSELRHGSISMNSVGCLGLTLALLLDPER